jgi:hypothetical protein
MATATLALGGFGSRNPNSAVQQVAAIPGSRNLLERGLSQDQSLVGTVFGRRRDRLGRTGSVCTRRRCTGFVSGSPTAVRKRRI